MSGSAQKVADESKSSSSKHSTSEGSRKNSTSSHSGDAGNVIVVCRFRPLNQNELNHGGSNV